MREFHNGCRRGPPCPNGSIGRRGEDGASVCARGDCLPQQAGSRIRDPRDAGIGRGVDQAFLSDGGEFNTVRGGDSSEPTAVSRQAVGEPGQAEVGGGKYARSLTDREQSLAARRSVDAVNDAAYRVVWTPDHAKVG